MEKLVKYYLCSDHFTDDCFLDPEKTRLKKSLRPIQVPIPTIFQCNLADVMPRDVSMPLPKKSHKRSMPTVQYQSPVKESSLSPAFKYIVTTDDGDSEVVICDDNNDLVDQEEESLGQEHPSIEEEEEEEELVEMEIRPSICRLCNVDYSREEDGLNLKYIFDDQGFLDALNYILPDGQINRGDEYSQYACQYCVTNVETSFIIVSNLRRTQETLRNHVTDEELVVN